MNQQINRIEVQVRQYANHKDGVKVIFEGIISLEKHFAEIAKSFCHMNRLHLPKLMLHLLVLTRWIETIKRKKNN